jgi:2-methylaconitate cis-trans-isomerase PrpF
MSERHRAAFIRGGTSKGLVFRAADLPLERAAQEAIFLRTMGSPDPYGRQLDGMGGGISSLSKVCIVGPSTRPDADVDYTFVQVQIREARCDWRGNCGNMSAAIGPFAVDEGLVESPRDGDALVRIHNTNTGKIIHSRFAVRGGRSVDEGDLEIPGVSGTGAAVRLDFMAPGGASTGRLLPTGRVVDTLEIAGHGPVQASLVDAANACVFLDAVAFGLTGTELPDALEADPARLALLEAVRRYASVAMGIAADLDEAAAIRIIPFVALVGAPQPNPLLDGRTLPADAADLVVRMISNGQPHRALPLTGSLCTAVAAAIEGTVPNRLARPGRSGALRLAMPSGVLAVDADVRRRDDGAWHAERGSFYRTTRRLFDGVVHA